MKKNWMVIGFGVVFLVSLFTFYKPLRVHLRLFSERFQKGEKIYFTGGNWGQIFDEEGHGLADFPHFCKTHYGTDVKMAKAIKNLVNVKKLVLFDVMPQFTKHFFRYPKEKMVLFLWEPPTVFPQNYEKKYHKYFSKIFTWDDDLVDNKTYFKLYYPQWKFTMTESSFSFFQKKLACLVGCNKNSTHPNELYSKRREVIAFFEKKAPEEFALFGRGWENEGFLTYKGAIGDKSCTGEYKFAFCYENLKDVNGYVTEKIFDAFIFGVVPIYWGAGNIEKYVPKNCFIDRREFSSNEELYQFLKSMPEEKHREYIENIKVFLQSDQVKNFQAQHLLETFVEAIGEKMPVMGEEVSKE